MNSPRKNITFLRAVICEDVRHEFDGRYSLMGVLSGEVNFSTDQPDAGSPTMELAFYVECQILETVTVHFRFLMPDGKTVVKKISGELPRTTDDAPLGLGAIPIQRSMFEFPMSGAYAFQGKADGGRWETLNRLHVNVARFDEGEAVALEASTS